MNAFTPVPSNPDASEFGDGGSAAETAMTRAMERLAAAGRKSAAEMLQQLRHEFPDAPLAVRVRALEALRRR